MYTPRSIRVYLCFQIIIIDMDGCRVTVLEIRPFNDPFFVKHLYESRQKKRLIFL